MLRDKNKYLKRGLIPQAEALARRIGSEIAKFNSASLAGVQSSEGGSKEMWAKIRELTNKRASIHVVPGISADSLNSHYAVISHDSNYVALAAKCTVSCPVQWATKFSVFFCSICT
jgi:hypothetical protein